MSHVTQTTFYDPADPDGPGGNCLQAALASVLGLPLDCVPDFTASDRWLRDMARWVAVHGYRVVRARPGSRVQFGLAIGPSPRGVDHAVVMTGGHMTWDPHPSRAGLVSIQHSYEFVPIPGRKK